jgi:hypothetical protein
MKVIYVVIVLLLQMASAHAQHPGFSKLYSYSGDTLRRADFVSTLYYDESSTSLYFCLSSMSIYDGSSSVVMFRSSDAGVVEKEILDTFPNGSLIYHTLAESSHGDLYWGGKCFIHGDSQSSWLLTKTDKDLNIIWKKTYPCDALDGNTIRIRLNEESGNILLLQNRFTNADNPFGMPPLPNRIIVREVDSSGNEVSVIYPGPPNWNNGTDFLAIDANDFYFSGRTFSWGQNQGTAFMMKTDSNGTEEWHEFYLQDDYTCYFEKSTLTDEDLPKIVNVGTVVPSSDNNGVAVINKVNQDGIEIWNRRIGVFSVAEQFFNVCNAQENDLVAIGAFYNPEIENARGWIVRFDKDGNVRWNKSLTAFPRTTDHEYLYHVLPLPDGSFIAAGSSVGPNVNGLWTQEGWLIRVDSNGCVDQNCSGNELSIKNKGSVSNHIKVFPNPASSKLFIKVDEPFHPGTIINLVDNLGRTVKTIHPGVRKSNAELKLDGLSPGIYYALIRNGADLFRQKVLIQ